MEDFEKDFAEIFAAGTSAESEPEEVAEESAPAPAETSETVEDSAPAVETVAPATPLRYKHLDTELTFDESVIKPIADVLGVTPSEAVVRLQKGSDYDRIKKSSEEMKPLFSTLKEFSAKTGMELPQVEKILGDTLRTAALQRAAAGIKTRHPDAPDDIVNEMAETEVKAQELSRSDEQQKAQEKQKEFVANLWRDFFTEFPTVDANALPDAVKNCLRDGKTPREAWLEHEAAELRQKIAVLEKAQENKQKSVGSAKGTVGDSVDDLDLYIKKLFSY